MLNAKDHKYFTATKNKEAEELLSKVLLEMKNSLSNTNLSIYLGGSYGRGCGGVRTDTENGILYNDLDLFVFTDNNQSNSDVTVLQEIKEKYEKELKIDVDFSKTTTVKEIRKNQRRLMMQELKRGYFLVCGKDLLAAHLEEIPAEKLPFSEACRLFLNRGMGILLAEDLILKNSDDKDFILRNINKAVLGSIDGYLIANNLYKWDINNRLEQVSEDINIKDNWKKLYQSAVEFKSSPNREMPTSIENLLKEVKELYIACLELSCLKKNDEAIDEALLRKSLTRGELSLVNYIKFCLKSREIHWPSKKLTMEPCAITLCKLYEAFLPNFTNSKKEKLFNYWKIFN